MAGGAISAAAYVHSRTRALPDRRRTGYATISVVALIASCFVLAATFVGLHLGLYCSDSSRDACNGEFKVPNLLSGADIAPNSEAMDTTYVKEAAAASTATTTTTPRMLLLLLLLLPMRPPPSLPALLTHLASQVHLPLLSRVPRLRHRRTCSAAPHAPAGSRGPYHVGRPAAVLGVGLGDWRLRVPHGVVRGEGRR